MPAIYLTDLTGYSLKKDYRKLLIAPINMRQNFLQMIDREIEIHKKYGNGYLIFKANAIVDPMIIKRLYQASQSGVKIRFDYPRNLLFATRNKGAERKHPCDQHSWQISGTQSYFLFPEQWRGRNLYGQCRPDAKKFESTG